MLSHTPPMIHPDLRVLSPFKADKLQSKPNLHKFHVLLYQKVPNSNDFIMIAGILMRLTRSTADECK